MKQGGGQREREKGEHAFEWFVPAVQCGGLSTQSYFLSASNRGEGESLTAPVISLQERK